MYNLAFRSIQILASWTPVTYSYNLDYGEWGREGQVRGRGKGGSHVLSLFTTVYNTIVIIGSLTVFIADRGGAVG
jgi:hypothetical protein